MNLIVLKQWFLTRWQAPQGASINFQGSVSFYPLCMESFTNKFTNKYTCFYNLFNVNGLAETKDYYFKGRRGIQTVKNHCLKVSSLNGEVVPA